MAEFVFPPGLVWNWAQCRACGLWYTYQAGSPNRGGPCQCGRQEEITGWRNRALEAEASNRSLRGEITKLRKRRGYHRA